MMKQNWHEIKLGAVCDKIGSGATPRGGGKVYTNEGVSLIRSQNVHNAGFKMNGLAHIAETHARQLAGVTVEPQDILLNITGDSVARTCQVASSILPARVNQHVAIIRPTEDFLSPRYLRYVLVQPSMQQHLLGLASSGATRNALTKQMIEDLTLLLPPLLEQKEIADVLSSLDDKIELLRRQNETLEKIAQAIFKEWFVEFNFPDKNGKPYKASGGKMIDSELGEIPDRWRVGRFDDILSVLASGKRPKGGVGNLTQGIPSIGAENINGLGKYDYGKEKYISSQFFETIGVGAVENGDVLLYKDGAHIGRISYFDFNFPHKVCTINEHVFRLRTNDNLPSQVYLYFWCDLSSTRTDIVNLNSNSAQPGINQQQVKSLSMLIPEKQIVLTYDKLVSKMMEKLFNNCNQVLVLSKLRDALLPILMSGQVRVNNV